MANILDGTFKIDENGISTLLSGPAFTVEILEKFKKLAEEAKDKNYSPEQFKTEAEKISPEVGLIAKYLPKSFDDMIKFLGFLLAAIALLMPAKRNEKSPPQTNIQVINNYAEKKEHPQIKKGKAVYSKKARRRKRRH